jgi:hypothetical protein
MDQEFERKLIELMEEAKERKMLAAHVVLHMLLGCNTSGKQAEFAQWCCKFSPFQADLQFSQPDVYDDFPKELDLGN